MATDETPDTEWTDLPDRALLSGEDLVSAMDSAARALLAGGDVGEAAERIVAGAIAAVPPVSAAGISLVETDRCVRSHAPSSVVVGELDRLQSELGEGPCLDAVWVDNRVEVPDTATATKWPRWTAAARERGVGSVLSFQLFARKGSAGALNLYAPEAHAFGVDAHHLGGLFASHAAVMLFDATARDHLNRALQTRDEIGQAKGILMERFSMTADQAFSLLIRSSQDTNVELINVARFLNEQVAAGSHRPTDPEPG